jgi:hypothetical protein
VKSEAFRVHKHLLSHTIKCHLISYKQILVRQTCHRVWNSYLLLSIMFDNFQYCALNGNLMMMMLIIIIIMSLGWDYVSELRLPMGLLFIPRWYMDVENIDVTNRQGKIPDSSITSLWQFYQQSSCNEAGGHDEGNSFLFQISLAYSQGSLTCRKIFDMWPTALLPLRRKPCYGFLSPFKS